MCDYCGCRSNPEIAALSADHETLSGLLAELGGAVDRADRRSSASVLGRIHRVLEPHTVREEVGVFTELRDAGVGDGYVDTFEREHLEIHALFDELDGTDWQRRARAVTRLLERHIVREETDLFPAAHQLLGPDQWDAVDVAVAQITR